MVGRSFIAVTLLVATLSGCVGSEPAPIETTADQAPPVEVQGQPVWIPVGAGDPGFDGPAYLPGVLEVTVPSTIVFVNNDTVEHVTVASRRATGGSAGGGSAHDHGPEANGAGGHDHGSGGHGDATFAVTTAPGGSGALGLTEPGRFAVHCHPHPWMTMEIVARLPSPVVYDVVWTEEVVRMEFSGRLAEADKVVHPFELPEGPVARVTATLKWDDSEDDVQDPDGGPVVQTEPDSLSLTLGTPDGPNTVTAADTARQGSVVVTLPKTDARPNRVMARDPHEAWELAGADAPAQPWLAGAFQASVTLDEAGDVMAPVGPLEDTGSSYELTIEVLVATAHPVGPGARPPANASGVEHAAHAAHGNHDHAH